MPRVIKKKTRKPARKEEDYTAVLDKIRQTAEARRKQIIGSVSAAIAIAVLALGIYFYTSNVENKALELRYEGYKLYHGLYAGESAAGGAKPAEALEKFKESYKTKEYPLTLMYIADSQYALGQYAEARETLDSLIRKYPGEKALMPMAEYKKAMADIRLGKTEDALEGLSKLAASGSRQYGDLALFQSARLLEDMGKHEEALEKYKQLINTYPSSVYLKEAIAKAGLSPEEGAAGEAGEAPAAAEVQGTGK